MYKIEAILMGAESPMTAKQIAQCIEESMEAGIKDFSLNDAERRGLLSRVRSALLKLEREKVISRIAETQQIRNLLIFKWQIEHHEATVTK